jgi:hypothetical protein
LENRMSTSDHLRYSGTARGDFTARFICLVISFWRRFEGRAFYIMHMLPSGGGYVSAAAVAAVLGDASRGWTCDGCWSCAGGGVGMSGGGGGAPYAMTAGTVE